MLNIETTEERKRMTFPVSPHLFEMLQKYGYIEEREGKWTFPHSEQEIVVRSPFLCSAEAIDIPDNSAKMSALRSNLRKDCHNRIAW